MYHTTLGEEVASSQKSDIIAIIKRRTYRIELCCSLVGIAWTAAVDAVAVAADAAADTADADAAADAADAADADAADTADATDADVATKIRMTQRCGGTMPH